jgi:hypothetical protein
VHRTVQVNVVGKSGTRATTIDYGPSGDQCHLQLSLDDGRTFTAVAMDYFACLISVRRELEAEGLVVCCQGARKNVWPSGMGRDMGAGLVAYVLTIGRAPRRDEQVQVLAPADAELIGTVTEQEQHFEAWRRSRHSPDDRARRG